MNRTLHQNRHRHEPGFSLIEMLTVIGIVSVLAVLVFPTYAKMQYKMDLSTTSSNLRQIVLGFNAYAADNSGMLPDTFNSSGVSNECWRMLTLFKSGYIAEPKVFVNPINARKVRGVGKNTFGPSLDCYFSAPSYVAAGVWTPGLKSMSTAVRIVDDPNVPVVWDQRADTMGGVNYVCDSEGNYAANFAYLDGSVRLITRPNSLRKDQ